MARKKELITPEWAVMEIMEEESVAKSFGSERGGGGGPVSLRRGKRK